MLSVPVASPHAVLLSEAPPSLLSPPEPGAQLGLQCPEKLCHPPSLASSLPVPAQLSLPGQMASPAVPKLWGRPGAHGLSSREFLPWGHLGHLGHLQGPVWLPPVSEAGAAPWRPPRERAALGGRVPGAPTAQPPPGSLGRTLGLPPPPPLAPCARPLSGHESMTRSTSPRPGRLGSVPRRADHVYSHVYFGPWLAWPPDASPQVTLCSPTRPHPYTPSPVRPPAPTRGAAGCVLGPGRGPPWEEGPGGLCPGLLCGRCCALCR